MAKVLAVSSFVASGSVGLRAASATMAARAVELIALPTVVLSNHTGYAHVAGAAVPPTQLAAMLAALDANDRLRGISGVLIGYLPSPEHVAFAVSAIAQVRKHNPEVLVMVDPVLGDDPDGLYVDAAAADAMRRTLVPIADILTPNRFELAVLSGFDVTDVATSITAARDLGRPMVAATSLPSGPMHLANVFTMGEFSAVIRVAKVDDVPHGTGDLFAAVLLAHLIEGVAPKIALSAAVATVEQAIARSSGSHDLALEALDWSATSAMTCDAEIFA